MPPAVPSGRLTAFLRFLERYTKTDMVYLTSGGFWLALDQIASGLAAFLLTIAFAHFVPKDAYGTYRFLLAAYWTLTAFTMTGLPTVVSQGAARGKEGVYRSSFMTSVFWSLPMMLIAFGVATYYFVHGNAHIGYGFVVIALASPFMQSAYLFGSYLIGKKEFLATAITGAVFAFIPAIILIAFMPFTDNPLVFISAYLGGTFIAGAALTLYTLLRYRPNRDEDADYRRTGGHYSAMNLLSTLAAQIDKLVVFHFLGPVDLAVYALATALPEQLRGLFGGVATLAFPKFSERAFGEIRANFWNRVALFTLLLTLIAVAYAFLAPFFFEIFFPAYPEAVPYSQVFVFALIPIGSSLTTALLQAHTAKRELYILNVGSGIIQIASLVILTMLYGLMGAIAARIIARAATFLLSVVLIEGFASRVGQTP
jgi:O-antigen/teichoic acid export membrane protein